MGAGKWRKKYSSYLAGRQVVIISDKDEPGRKHAEDVAKSLLPVAQSVKILEVPYGKDVSEWLSRGGTEEELQKMSEELPNWTVLKELDKKANAELENLWNRIKVLGHTENLEIVLRANGKLMFLKDCLRKSQITMLTGIEEEHVVKNIKAELLRQAHEAGCVDSSERLLPGVWRINDSWLLVSGNRASEIREGKVTNLDKPVVTGKIVEFGESWLDWPIMEQSIAKSKESLTEAFNAIREYVIQWNWRDEYACDYVTAFIMLSFFQQAMEWRPLLYLTGPRGCGKTTFFQLVCEPLFGELARRMDKSTAHAIAQEVGNSGRILILDEFESHKHVGQVLNFLKGGSSRGGGSKTSGTTGARANIYRIHHLVWLGSIFLPSVAASDSAIRDRMIVFELLRPEKTKQNPSEISTADGKKIAAKIVGGLIACWHDIEKLRVEIRGHSDEVFKRVAGADHRTVDNFVHAAAVLQLVTGKPYSVPDWAAKDDSDDGALILETILSSKFRSGVDEFSVAEIIEDQSQNFERKKELARNGVKLTNTGGKKFIAFKTSVVTRYLLKGSQYEFANIDCPLLRMPGAKRHKVKWLSSQTVNCIIVPADWNHRNHSGTNYVTSKNIVYKESLESSSKGSNDLCHENYDNEEYNSPENSLNTLSRSDNNKTLEPFSGRHNYEQVEEVAPKFQAEFDDSFNLCPKNEKPIAQADLKVEGGEL
jgi:DNA polymerase III delta prime subunit